MFAKPMKPKPLRSPAEAARRAQTLARLESFARWRTVPPSIERSPLWRGGRIVRAFGV